MLVTFQSLRNIFYFIFAISVSRVTGILNMRGGQPRAQALCLGVNYYYYPSLDRLETCAI